MQLTCLPLAWHSYALDKRSFPDALTCAAYGEQIREVERGSFTPLVLSLPEAMASEATELFKFLARCLSEKFRQLYSMLMGKLHTHLAFSLVRDSVWMLRGSRRPFRYPALSLLLCHYCGTYPFFFIITFIHFFSQLFPILFHLRCNLALHGILSCPFLTADYSAIQPSRFSPLAVGRVF